MESSLLVKIQELRQKFNNIGSVPDPARLQEALDDAINLYVRLYCRWSGSACTDDNGEQEAYEWLSKYVQEESRQQLTPSQKSRQAKQAMAYYAYYLDLKTKSNGFSEPNNPSPTISRPMPRHTQATSLLQDAETDLGYLIEPYRIVLELNALDLNNVSATRTVIRNLRERLRQQSTSRCLILEELAMDAMLAQWLLQAKQRDQESNLNNPSFPIMKLYLGSHRHTIAFCMQLSHNGSLTDDQLVSQKYELRFPPNCENEKKGKWILKSSGLVHQLTQGTVEVEWLIEVPENGTFLADGNSSEVEFTIYNPQVRQKPWKCTVEVVPANEPGWRDSSEAAAKGSDPLGFSSRRNAIQKLKGIFDCALAATRPTELTIVAVAGLAGMGRKDVVEQAKTQSCLANQNMNNFEQRIAIIPFEADDDGRPCVSYRAGDGWNPDRWKKVLTEASNKTSTTPQISCIVVYADLADLIGDYPDNLISSQHFAGRGVNRQTIKLGFLEDDEIQTMFDETLRRQMETDNVFVVLDPRCGRFIREATDGYPELVAPLITQIVDNLRKKHGWYVSRKQIDAAISDLCNVKPALSDDLDGHIKEFASSRLRRAFPQNDEFEIARWLLMQVEKAQSSSDDIRPNRKRGVFAWELTHAAQREPQRDGSQGKNLLSILNKLVAQSLLTNMDGVYQIKSNFLVYWARREAREFSSRGPKR